MQGSTNERIASAKRRLAGAFLKVRDGAVISVDYTRTRLTARAHRQRFENVRLYCTFVGYPRSGHTLVGALLTAHPNIVISHELDALRYVSAGFNRDQLFALILERDRRFVDAGASWTGYRYDIVGQAQGSHDRLRVIGDKCGGKTAMRVAEDPGILHRLQKTVKCDLRFLHVVRNPFDNIATMFRKNDLPMAAIIDRYFEHCRGSALTLQFAGPARVLTFAHEDLVANARAIMTQVCDFLGCAASADYLDACAQRVFETPRHTRTTVPWRAEDRRAVESRMAQYPFLQRYLFDDGV